jgi:serine/threonine protein phosphatase PrpC
MTSIVAAGCTHIGGKPRNEDAYFISDAYMGVFDGHGEYGKEIADAVTSYFSSLPPASATVTRAKESFAAAEDLARETIKKNPKGCYFAPREAYDGSILDPYTGTLLRGGTTGTVAHIEDGKVRVAHVGDSEVMVVHESGDFSILTKDHSTTCVAEYERIVAEAKMLPRVEFAFMSVHRPVFVRSGTPTGWMINPLGGVRTCNMRKEWSAYLRGKMPNGYSEGEGLNMMRSIGDFSLKKHGVCAVPDLVEHTLRPGRSYVLLGSDGLFDNFKYEDLRGLVLKGVGEAEGGVKKAADAILAEGIKVGFKNFGLKGQDNTTLILAIVDVLESTESFLKRTAARRLSGGC